MGMRMAMRMGIKFELSDEEALQYLFDKSAGRLRQPYTVNGAVTEQDLYGDKEPWEVFMEGREKPFCNQELRYYYTNLKRMQRKKHGPGERFLRTVGKNRKGTWSGLDKPHQIFNYKGQLLGIKKCYAYENKGSPEHGRWLMKEYSLDGRLLNQGLPVPDLVLCRINENVGRGSGRGKQRQVPQSSAAAASTSAAWGSSSAALTSASAYTSALAVWEPDLALDHCCFDVNEFLTDEDWEGSGSMEGQVQTTSGASAFASASASAVWGSSSAASASAASTLAVRGHEQLSDRDCFNVDEFLTGEDWEICKRLMAEDQL